MSSQTALECVQCGRSAALRSQTLSYDSGTKDVGRKNLWHVLVSMKKVADTCELSSLNFA